MKQAFINKSEARAVCCWDAPDQLSVEALFTKAGIATASVEEVVEYPGG
ncbi:MAG: hypothetical protein QNJ97_24505 [Myxococcota bacterium]|nr:hypothetical protein [Myxococcota bacterium]